MSNPPVFSIVMPAYNAAETLAGSVDSVRAQTLEAWELIIVDDGSSDVTLSFASTLAAGDDRICVVSQKNAGPSAARNHGVRLTQARFVAFLDADDAWAPERLAGLLAVFEEEPQTGVAFSRTRFVDAASLKRGPLSRRHTYLNAADLMAENPVCSASNIACRRRVLTETGPFREDLRFAEDQDWLLRVALAGDWRIRGVDAEWFFYRCALDSQSADLDAMKEGWRALIASASTSHPIEAAKAERAAFGPFHRYLARRALRLREPRRAMSFLAEALRRDPLLLLREPRRTGLTVLGASAALLPSKTLRELAAR